MNLFSYDGSLGVSDMFPEMSASTCRYGSHNAAMPSIDLPTSDHHTGTTPTPEGSNAVPGDEVSDMEHLLDRFQCQLPFSQSPLELQEEMQKADSSWSPDGDLQDCGQLDSRWVLWHEFMKEYNHLDAWLRLAEGAVSSPNSFHVTYQTAKEELRKCERLRQEAAPQLVQLDSLTQRNRTLTPLFQSAMQTRLLASVRECGRRWDDVNAKLESITGRLQLLVSEWEWFEAQWEKLALWLADMDVRLSEVDQLTGNACEKLRLLQSFQQCVCMNSGHVNALLQRGEALIQHSEPSDAQHIESRLLELLQHCSHVYDNIARTHTRVLSMRLVFEDDCILSQATDSGCPSENLLEDEGTVEKQSIDLSASSNHHIDPPSPLNHPPPSSPTHDNLGLEWDPSVDIGRCVPRDDADSSCFSASAGLCQRDGLKRWTYLSSSHLDISADTGNWEADLEWLDHAQPDCFLPVADRQEESLVCRKQWKISTPKHPDDTMFDCDGSRLQAWLRVQSAILPEKSTSCSKAVQTDGELKCYMEGSHVDTFINSQHWHEDTKQCSPSLSHDLKLKTASDWTRNHLQSKAQEDQERHCCKQLERLVPEESVHHVTSSSNRASTLLSPALIYLLAVALALLACLTFVVLEPRCNRISRTFHLTLRYVNGPPPT